MSKLTNIKFSFKMLLSFKNSKKFSVSDVSWTLLLIFKTWVNKNFSRKITLTELSALCVLMKWCAITSVCGTAAEDLSIIFEKCMFLEVLKIESRVQDTSEMLNFMDFLNESNILMENCMLVSLDIANMFPSIDNESDLQAVKNALEAREEQFPPNLC